MPEHAPVQPSAPRGRRPLAGALAIAVTLVLAACGTANGALRPEPGPSGTAASTAPATALPTTADSPSPHPGPPSAGAPSATAPSTGATAPGTSTATPSRPATGRPSTGGPATTAPKPPPPAPAPTVTPAPPAGQVPSALVTATASGGRTVALTFDDGPGGATAAVLDLLAQYGARATFCLVGRQVQAHPDLVRRILTAGHRLCDHSVSHPQPFAGLPHDTAVHQIADAREAIVRAGGPGTRVAWFRAPGGGFTADNRQIAADHGMRPLGWTVDPRDWSRPGAAAVVAAVQRDLRPGGVVLLHDGGGDRGQTVEALRRLLPWLVAQGYRFDFPAG